MNIKCLLTKSHTLPAIVLSEYKINHNFDLLPNLQCEICFQSEKCDLFDSSNVYVIDTSLSQMLDYFSIIKKYEKIECSPVLCAICINQLVSSYSFLKKIGKSKEILKGLVKLDSRTEDWQKPVKENENLGSNTIGSRLDVKKKDNFDGVRIADEPNFDNSNANRDEPKDSLLLKHVDVIHDHSYIQISCKPNPTDNVEGEESEVEPKETRIINEEYANIRQKEFVCNLCKTAFARKQSLDNHIRRVHLNEKTFQCFTCLKQFFLRADYNRHILLHTGETSHKCNLCKKGFVTSNLLKNHKKTVHKEKEIRCTQCPKLFKLHAQLRRHVVSVHGVHPLEKNTVVRVKEKVECTICRKKINKYALKTHMERHSGSKKYQCEICGQEFFQLLNLNTHMIRHQDPKFSCEYCGKSHFTKQEMLTHIRRQHTREIVCTCEHCGKGFVHQTNLIQHIRNCHPGDNEEKFVEPKIPKRCTVCGKIYSSRTSLIHHRRRAHENKGYSCTECEMTFRNLVPFKSHLKKVHDIGDTYNCDICNKSCYTREDLCKHKKRTHYSGANSLYLCCTVCKVEKFKTKHDLIQHMQDEHIQDASADSILYECNICATFFVSFEIFHKHLSAQHPSKIEDKLVILEYEVDGCKVQYFHNKRNVEPEQS